MKYIKIYLSALFAFFLLVLSTSQSFAAGGEPTYGQPVYGEPVYGGGVIVSRADMMVDKKVKNPATGEFVDHLSASDPKYKPKDIVEFKILVRNPGEENLDQVVIKDVFPKVSGTTVIDFMSGPGEFDSDAKTLTFTVSDLAPGTTQDFTIKGRVVHPALLPKDKNVVCTEPGNIVEAFSGKLTDRDEAKFCIVKEIEKEVPVVPKAGPGNILITLAGTGIAAATGLFLRKKAYQV